MYDRKSLGKNMKLDNSIRKAFKTNGLRAEYHGLPALVLPVDSMLAARINYKTGEKSVLPGEIIVVRDYFGTGKLRPNHDGTFNGRRFDVNQPCDLEFRIPRHDSSSINVKGRNISEITIAMMQANDAVRNDREKIIQEYQSAVRKGERPPKPEKRQTKIDTSGTCVFRDIGGLIRTVEEQHQAILADRSAKPELKAEANDFLDALRSQCNNIPSEFEDERINYERKLRRNIARLQPDHPEAQRIPSHEELDALRNTLAQLEDDLSAHETLDQKARDNFDKVMDMDPLAVKSPVSETGNEPALPGQGM